MRELYAGLNPQEIRRFAKEEGDDEPKEGEPKEKEKAPPKESPHKKKPEGEVKPKGLPEGIPDVEGVNEGEVWEFAWDRATDIFKDEAVRDQVKGMVLQAISRGQTTAEAKAILEQMITHN